MALLDGLPTAAISEIVQRLNPRLYIDFIRYLPAEICLKILAYLDPVSLVSVTQTCRAWYDLALDRKLWESLYHLEGWKAIQREIDIWETKVNMGLNNSIGHLHRIQTAEGHTSKVRPMVSPDGDLEMLDHDRLPSMPESMLGGSIFGSPNSSFSSNRRALTPMGEMETDSSSSKGKSVDRSFGSTELRGKRKEPGGEPQFSLPPILPSDDRGNLVRSTLWMWDVNSSRYRINWKYLYNMRRRLESNWELGKFNTFQLPHPNFPDEGHQECVYTLQFDADYVVSGSRDRTMRIWNLHTRRLVRPPLTGHKGSVLCLQFDADPDEDLLVSGSSDSNVFIWKFSTGELLQELTRAHRESVLNVRFDKRILVTSSKDKSIKIFNRRPLRYGDVGYGHNHAVVEPVAQSLRRYGYEPDLAQELPVKPPFTMIGRLDGHTAAVNAIQVRDETIVSVSGDRHIKLWNWPEQVCTRTIPAHDKGIACVEFDGRRIVSGSSDWEVCIFDVTSGLKVAQLRGHSHLVRTVQAGFGDFPYSTAEDEATAKAVDAEYYRAVDAGEIEGQGSSPRGRLSRQANAGSSRPEDVQAVGGKIPPGGGGGRKYGRIVSGSYDQTIIIWRRDKEGVWKAAHHLRQEEAAAAARRQAAPLVPTTRRPASILAAQPAVQLPGTQLPLPGGSQQLAGISHLANLANQPMPGQDGQAGGHRPSPAMYMALIDQVVPLGPGALQQALAYHPGMLAHHTYLQASIEREPSPFVRSQLRHVVTNALLTIQNNQAMVPPMMGAPPAAPSSSVAAAAGSISPGEGGSIQLGTPQPIIGSAPSQPAAVTASPAPTTPLPQPPAQLGQNATGQAQAPTPAPVLATPAAAAAAAGAAGAAPVTHHPHIGPAESAPARVFKLQFDARRILCCTQAPVVVGWDFCNADPELEEAARFFATVD